MVSGPSTTSVRSRGARPAPPPGDPGLFQRWSPARRRRRGMFALLGVVLVAAGGLVGSQLVMASGDRSAVLAVTRPVPYGAVIRDEDLTVARVGLDPALHPVAASRRGEVVGRFAATELRPGTLLTSGQVTTTLLPGPAAELVGVAVKASQLPARPLHTNDRVLIVSTPPQDGDPPAGQPPSMEATVVSVGTPDENGVRVVDVRVAAGTGPSLAARAATGRIAIVVEPSS